MTRKQTYSILFGLITLIVVFGPICYFNQFGEDQPRIGSSLMILHSLFTGSFVFRLFVLIEGRIPEDRLLSYLALSLMICGFWFVAYTLRDGM